MEYAIPATKLDMDLGALQRLGRSMNDDVDERIAVLCTRIGTIMEDTSVVAIEAAVQTRGEQDTALAQVEGAIGRMQQLLAEVRSIASQS